jgi:predicted regulator of Ras-like GTPase activity (Roadblock/LC7/MglB family)
MKPEQALADLTEISSQIEAAVVFDAERKVIGSTLADESRAGQVASAAGGLWRSVQEVKPGSTPTQFEVATTEGSLFVVRDDETYIAATTGRNPTVGLVFYDLKSTLRNLKKEPEPEPPAQEETTQKPATKPRKASTASGTKKKTAARKTTTRKRKNDAP